MALFSVTVQRVWGNLCVLCVLSEAGGLKTKAEPQRRKGRKGNYAFPIGVADGERTMMEMLKRHYFLNIIAVSAVK